MKKQPIIIINFKNYKQGNDVIALAQKIARAAQSPKIKIILAVSSVDISLLTGKISLPIFGQHVDSFESGRHTGFILAAALKKAGGDGTLLNHSEHPLSFDVLKETMCECKKNKLETAVFAKNLAEEQKIETLQPDYLIYEPPALVGGNISVTKSDGALLKKFVHTIRMPFLIGAGIRTAKDVEEAAHLGAGGIAVSSVIMQSRNPNKMLKELIKGFE
ncbi:MAG: triose-phosphate isomerase [Nanoarchaeota archaeon]